MAKAKRGRPKLDSPLAVRMLIRLDKGTGEALKAFAVKSGAGAATSAARMILMERLRADGFLK